MKIREFLYCLDSKSKGTRISDISLRRYDSTFSSIHP